MRTSVSIIWLLLLIHSIGFGQKIKSISEISYARTAMRSDFEAPYKSYPEHFDFYFDGHEMSEYNKDGNIVLESNINENGRTTSISEVTYLDSIHISRIDYKFPADSTANYSILYQYNGHLQLIQKITVDNQEVNCDSIFYPKPGIKETRFYSNGEIIRKTVSNYDSTDSTERIYHFDDQDSLLFITSKLFNEKQQLINSIHYDKHERPLNSTSYEYDNSGIKNYEKRESYGSNEIVENISVYDSIENEYTLKELHNGKLIFWSKTHYDKFKNEVLTEFYDDSGVVRFSKEYKYEYDINDNWIKKMEYKNKELQSVTYRSIEYL